MGLLDDLRSELIARGGVSRLFEVRGLTLPKALDALQAELAASAPWKVRQQARRDLLGYLGAVAQAPDEAGSAAGAGFDALLTAYWAGRQAGSHLPEAQHHVIDVGSQPLSQAEKPRLLPALASRGLQPTSRPRGRGRPPRSARPGPPQGEEGEGGTPKRPPAKEEQVPESRSIPLPPSGRGELAGGGDVEE
jgi:hypothetical protein